MNIISKYQLVLLGDIQNQYKEEIEAGISEKVKELGIAPHFIKTLDCNSFGEEYDPKSPSVAIYFGCAENPNSCREIAVKLMEQSGLIIPALSDVDQYEKELPEELHPIESLQLDSSQDVKPIVTSISEGFGLVKRSRSVFISYQPKKSTGVAVQLFEKLEELGFDVFLDTHKELMGDNDEVWEKFADTDNGIILNTPGFLEKNWNSRELAKANFIGIGMLQIIWPEHKTKHTAAFTYPHRLKPKDFKSGRYKSSNGTLSPKTVQNITEMMEALRARNLASRRDTLVTEFLSSARKYEIKAHIQPHKYITLESTGDVIVPTVGVPDAFTYNQSVELIRKIRNDELDQIWILYDNRSVQSKWLDHMSWLDEHLPIQSIKITDVEEWLRELKDN